jgi:cell division septation protein DedD
MAPRNRDHDLDDEAPWLAEAVPPQRTEVSRRSLFWTVFIVLALATIAAVGLVLLMSKKDSGSTQGYMNAEQAPVITAEPGPYKVAPADPAGMRIDGLDGTMYTAGEGIDQGSAIDPSLAPEAPLPRPGAVTGPPRDLVPEPMADPSVAAAVQRPAAPVIVPPVAAAKVTAPPAVPAAKPVAPAPKPVAAAPAKPLVTLPRPADASPAAKPGTVQLGAFSTEDKANAAWSSLAARHSLSGKRVVAVISGDKTLYRLRAASGDPATTCAKLQAAGDACAIVE